MDDASPQAGEARSRKLRAFYARVVTERGGAADHRIEQAFAAVPREPFAGPGPWFVLNLSPWNIGRRPRSYLQTPDDDAAFLYHDSLIAIDPARGINIGEPSLHARCLDALSPQPGETVVQIGAGSGYYSAILAELVGPRGQVIAFEIEPDLVARAEANLRPWPWARVEGRSGVAADLPKADAIYVNAGAARPMPEWLDALRPHGRLLFPLQPEGGFGGMLLAQRPDARASTVWPARFVSRAAFISCQGGQVEGSGDGLASAFADESWDQVRALHLDDQPNETCWFKGDGWWLSTQG
jgi:protein-L-isoaspartate(D-aspartate) O-methyltransferase